MSHTGKDGFPTLGFNCTVNHHRRFLNVADACPGSYNDKAKAYFDRFVTAVAKSPGYTEVGFRVQTARDKWEVVKGVYLIVDGGYQRWRTLQCPLKHSSNKRECLHSKWLG